MSPRILIFAKAPLPGFAKTRLAPAIGTEGAARLHFWLVERTVGVALRAGCAAVELWCTPDCGHPLFQHCRNRFGVTLYRQQGADLGERMYEAACSAATRGGPVILLGSDIPALGADDLRTCVKLLSGNTDAVALPIEDGGYGLLGMREVRRSVFEGIRWGSSQVMEQTRERFRQLRWHWHELPLRWDLDRPEDLLRLRQIEAAVPLFHEDG